MFRQIWQRLNSKRYSLLEVLVSLVLLVIVIGISVRERNHALLSLKPLPAFHLTEKRNVEGSKIYIKDYNFTSDWFTSKIPAWEEALEPFKGKPGISYLEVGVYEGRATMWMIENVLTHPTSKLTGIDLFEGAYSEHYGSFKERYLSNLRRSGASNRATTIQGFSQTALRGLPLNSFDIIYIDGSHINADVLEDAVLSWRLLKEGGVLIFDDYGGENTDPKIGIDTFFNFFGRHFEVIHNAEQLFLKKKDLS